MNNETNQEKILEQKLKKIFILNKKDPEKKNDNLIKIVANPVLLITAYENIQSNKGFFTKEIDPQDVVDGFNRPLIDNISEQIKTGTYK